MPPSLTGWTRLEPRPRTHTLTETLGARIRDPLWMLTRQLAGRRVPRRRRRFSCLDAGDREDIVIRRMAAGRRCSRRHHRVRSTGRSRGERAVPGPTSHCASRLARCSIACSSTP